MDWTSGILLILILALVVGAAVVWAIRGRRPAGRPATDPDTVTTGEQKSTTDTGTATTVAEPATAPTAAAEPAEPATVPAQRVDEPAAVVDEPAPAAVVDRAPVDAVADEPAAAEPATAEPAVSQPAATEPAVSQPAVAEPAVAEPAVSGAVGGTPDDFRRIQGIGPKIATALQSAGIRTYQQLAETDEETLRATIRGAGLRVVPALRTWPEQARALASAGNPAGPDPTR